MLFMAWASEGSCQAWVAAVLSWAATIGYSLLCMFLLLYNRYHRRWAYNIYNCCRAYCRCFRAWRGRAKRMAGVEDAAQQGVPADVANLTVDVVSAE